MALFIERHGNGCGSISLQSLACRNPPRRHQTCEFHCSSRINFRSSSNSLHGRLHSSHPASSSVIVPAIAFQQPNGHRLSRRPHSRLEVELDARPLEVSDANVTPSPARPHQRFPVSGPRVSWLFVRFAVFSCHGVTRMHGAKRTLRAISLSANHVCHEYLAVHGSSDRDARQMKRVIRA